MLKVILLPLLLSGCVMPHGVFVSGEASMMQSLPNASDWQMRADGKVRDNIGMVSVKAGYAITSNTDIYTGVSHLSLADFGNDKGYNSLIIGLQSRKQW
jgi:hypothetical protein